MLDGSSAITVMVTGVGGGGHGEQILKALRLAKHPYVVVGSDISPYSSGLSNVDHAYLLPPASDLDYLPTLIKVCRRHNVRALFHGSEPELRVMNAERETLAAAGLFLPINPPEVIRLCMDKVQTAETLASLGFRVPFFRRITTLSEAVAFPRFPAVIKPSVGGGGSANIFLVQTRDEVAGCARQLLAMNTEFIMQAYVGTPDAEYTVGVLTDMQGKLLNSIAVRRYILSALSNRIKVPNRGGNAKLGPVLAVSGGISQGEIGRFPEVTSTCEKIALAIGSRGPINIQCRLVDGEVYVFEINPRFSGTTSLRAMAGYNEPDVLIRRHLLGEEIQPHFTYQEGVILRSLSERFVKAPVYPVAKNVA